MFKYSLNDIVRVEKIIAADVKILDRLSKQDMNLYQVEIVNCKEFYNKYRDEKFWYAEHELKEIEG